MYYAWILGKRNITNWKTCLFDFPCFSVKIRQWFWRFGGSNPKTQVATFLRQHFRAWNNLRLERSRIPLKRPPELETVSYGGDLTGNLWGRNCRGRCCQLCCTTSTSNNSFFDGSSTKMMIRGSNQIRLEVRTVQFRKASPIFLISTIPIL